MRVKNIIGFGLIGAGIVLSFFSRFFCADLCLICLSRQLASCFFLFIFAGIMFIISGAALILEG